MSQLCVLCAFMPFCITCTAFSTDYTIFFYWRMTVKWNRSFSAINSVYQSNDFRKKRAFCGNTQSDENVNALSETPSKYKYTSITKLVLVFSRLTLISSFVAFLLHFHSQCGALSFSLYLYFCYLLLASTKYGQWLWLHIIICRFANAIDNCEPIADFLIKYFSILTHFRSLVHLPCAGFSFYLLRFFFSLLFNSQPI